MYNIGIVGLGFLGGSLAKSLIKTDKVKKIVAYDKNIESLISAKNDKVITDYTDKIDGKFYECDIVFICTPVKLIPSFAQSINAFSISFNKLIVSTIQISGLTSLSICYASVTYVTFTSSDDAPGKVIVSVVAKLFE